MTSVSAEFRSRHGVGSGVEGIELSPDELLSESLEIPRDLPPSEVWAGWAQPTAVPGGDVKTEEDIRHITGEHVDGNGAPAASSDTVEIDLDLEEAWEHRAELTEICRRIVGDPAIAEDVVQETYLQAFRNRHTLEKRDGLMPWLVTVAKRRSLNEIRRQKYSTPVDEVPERRSDPEWDPAHTVAIGDELDRVAVILGSLTDRERELLTRQVYDGASLAELAAEEDTTPASVRSVLSRARSKIKAAVRESAAHILAPIAVAADWVRDHASGIHHRFNQTAPVLPAGQEKLTEILVAAGAGIALLLSTSLPAPTPATDEPVVEEAPEPESLLPASAEPVSTIDAPGVTTVVADAYHDAAAAADPAGASASSSTAGDRSSGDSGNSPPLPDGSSGDDDLLADPFGGDDDDPDLLPDPDPRKIFDPEDGGDEGEGQDGVLTDIPAPTPEDVPPLPGGADEPVEAVIGHEPDVPDIDAPVEEVAGPSA